MTVWQIINKQANQEEEAENVHKKISDSKQKCHIRNNNNTYWKIVRVNGMDFVDWVNWIKLKSTNHEKERNKEKIIQVLWKW